jgi:hypothetical protein
MTATRLPPKTRISPAVASFRSQLTVGEAVVDPSTWAGAALHRQLSETTNRCLSEVGGGYGGYNQDHEFFGYRQTI